METQIRTIDSTAQAHVLWERSWLAARRIWEHKDAPGTFNGSVIFVPSHNIVLNVDA